jgi:hypothetical protein
VLILLMRFRQVRLNVNNIKIVGAIQNRYKSTTKVVNQRLQEVLQGG